MRDLIKDISTITTIPADALEKLVTKGEWCICDYVEDTILGKDSKVVEINIGLGVISIVIDSDRLIYRFIPSEKLEESVINTVKNETNPLKKSIEKSLVNKITNVYKELL